MKRENRENKEKGRENKSRQVMPLEHFLIQFGIRKVDFGSGTLFVEDNKYFLITPQIQDIIKKTKKPFYVGNYLGKARGKKFFPSISLLNMVSRKSQNKVWVDKKTEWLFVCGRDLFSNGIIKVSPGVKKGTITLILNNNNEVLGFGKVTKSLNESGAVIENILDIGDFLRRERKRK
jgi:ribosome biogenesis protein Nip4